MILRFFGWILWTLLVGIVEDMLVIARLKWRDNHGVARWRR
jgi:hypothetical protein